MTHTLTNWVEQASDWQFPVLSASKRRLLELLDNEDNIKVDDLVSIARLDPGFSISLLRAAGTRSRQKREITTHSHAILLLSIPQAIKLLCQLPQLEKTVEAELAHRIKRLYFYQHLTGTLARDWSVQRKESETNELFTAGLNHDFIHLFLYLSATPAALQLYQYSTTRLSDLRDKEREILGCSVAELSTAVATAWNLPFLIRESYADSHHNPKVNGICLASELVQWMYIHKTFDYPEKLHSNISSYMRVPDNKTHGLINRTVLNVFRKTHGKLPAGAVIRAFMSHPARLPEELAQQAPPTSSKEILLHCLRQLRTLPGDATIQTALQLALDGLHEALGFSRSGFMLLDKQSQSLVTSVTAANAASKQLKKCGISLELNKLFRQLMKKESLLLVHDANQHKYMPHMPPGLQAESQHGALLVHSIAIGNNVIGCFVINHKKNRKNFSERELQAYKKVCKELKAALVLISDKQDKQAA